MRLPNCNVAPPMLVPPLYVLEAVSTRVPVPEMVSGVDPLALLLVLIAPPTASGEAPLTFQVCASTGPRGR